MKSVTTKTESRTYTTTQSSRGCEEFSPSRIVYTDTIFADGRVVSNVRGTSDGEYVNVTSERHVESVDFDRIERARLSSGWCRV